MSHAAKSGSHPDLYAPDPTSPTAGLAAPVTVLPGRIFHSSKRTLPGGSAKGYKWMVRYPGNKRVLKEVPADRALQSITVGITRRSIDVARGQRVSSDPGEEGPRRC